MMKNIEHVQSHNDAGVQMVDIITSCIRRSMKGNLAFEAWKYLSSLIVHRKMQEIELISFNDPKNLKDFPYTKFVNYFKNCCKTMWVPQSIKDKVINKAKMGYAHWSYYERIIKPPSTRALQDIFLSEWLFFLLLKKLRLVEKRLAISKPS
ncbi:hypothetical protein [Coxiella burnetii]|uniref:hypothetical protein n=1 Tax=Coxiella burnetii TaxID=777 RepID=UPI0021765908|nr:hypothetical protein [Coxiella burnetii]